LDLKNRVAERRFLGWEQSDLGDSLLDSGIH